MTYPEHPAPATAARRERYHSAGTMNTPHRIIATAAIGTALAFAAPARLDAQLLLDVPSDRTAQAEQKKADGAERSDEKIRTVVRPGGSDAAAKRRAANVKGTALLGIGSIGLYSIGGGQTHEGQEAAGVNPKVFMSAGYFFIDGFALGLYGTFQYSKSSAQITLPIIPLVLKTTSTGMGGTVGLIAQYYFRASDRIFPYLGITVDWGMNKNSSIIGTVTVSGWELGAHAGMNFMAAPGLGLFLEVGHVRVLQGTVNPKKFGYITSINLGLKVFI